MGSKRPRPWARQPSGNSGSVAVAAAAAAFALAALSLPEADALSGSCAASTRNRSKPTGRWGNNSGGTTCIADHRDGPARRRKGRLVLSSSSSSSSSSGGRGACKAPSSRSGGHVRVRPHSSPPVAVPVPVADGEGGSKRNGSRGNLRHQDGPASRSITAISASRVLEPPPRPPAARPRGNVPSASGGGGGNSRKANNGSTHKSKTFKKGHRWKSDNDVRMFLMERGLSQREVRKVLPVMRRDPELVNDVATLAARMQAIADLLEAAVSWHSPESDTATTGKPREEAVKPESEGDAARADKGAGSVPSASTPTELRQGARSLNRLRSGQQGGGRASASHQMVPPPPPTASAPPAWFTGGVGGNRSQLGEDTVAQGMAAMRLLGGVGGDRDWWKKDEHDATPHTPAAAASVEGLTDGAEGEGPRLQAYQLVSSEPRLLLLRAEPDLSNRLRFLLDLLPGLRRGYWNGRLRRAAPLLGVETVTLGRRFEALVEIFPAHVDLQAVLDHAPLLLRHSTETVAAALANTERLIPGLRVDRVLRSAPHVLIQPLDVVEKRLSHLRKVLGLAPSPELEKLRAEMDLGPRTSSGRGGARGSGGGEGERGAGVRTLARFANAFPQILTMEPHTVRAKIEGLEELLPGMDGLAVVTSRPHLLGFSIRQNVSLKVSGLRALMARQRAGPEEPRQEQHQQQQQQQTSASAGDDLAAAVTRCPSLLTLSSETAARKVEELQEALPPGLDARVVVAKEPRVLALDTASTVPRKLDGLTRALAAHAARGGDGEEAVATAAAQVLRYYPNALRLDPATLAGKLEALRGAGLSPETVLSVVGGAPRCLSAAARTLEQRVSTLKEAFPSICVDGMLGKAPRLLQNRIDPAARVKVLQELFPSVNPLQLVEGAPMLLALSDGTLRAKSEAWRSVLEARVEQSWEQAIAEFPQLLCQGLGRAARVAFLLLPVPADASAAAVVPTPATIAPFTSASNDGDAVRAAAEATALAAVSTRTMSAATACHEVCRRVADFESDHPSYPAFLDSLLLAAPRCQHVGGARVAVVAGGDRAVLREQENNSPDSAAPLWAMKRGVFFDGVTVNHAGLETLAGDQRLPNQRHGGPGAAATTAAGIETAGGAPNRQTGTAAPMPPLTNNGRPAQQQPLPGAAAVPSPVTHSIPVKEARIAVTSEKALGDAMAAAAKGPGGGEEAAAMLLLEGVEVQRSAGGR